MNLTPNVNEIIASASLLQYPYSAASQSPSSSPRAPSNPPVPLSMAVTDFHFLLLYHDRVCAVSSLDDKLVYEEFLGLVCELVVGISACSRAIVLVAAANRETNRHSR